LPSHGRAGHECAAPVGGTSLLESCGLDRGRRSFLDVSSHAQPQPHDFDEERFEKLLREQRESSRVGVLAILLAVTSFVFGVILIVTTFIHYVG
jgi:hypothetical protein